MPTTQLPVKVTDGTNTLAITPQGAIGVVYSSGTFPVSGTVTTFSAGTAAQTPIFLTSQLITALTTANQVILAFTPLSNFNFIGFNVFVLDTMTSYSIFFGESSLESPAGTKLHTVQLTSLGEGKYAYNTSIPFTFPAHQTIQITCSPSAPINTQTWRANLMGF